MASKAAIRRPGSPPRPVVRIVFLLASAFTAWHLFASFLWISPPSVLRQVVPGDMLTSYMIPWFGQSWSVFAPAPINGDYTLKVRAILTTPTGESGPTRWVDATAVEQRLSRYQLFPPRAAGLAVHQASNLFGTWSELSTEQQDIAKLNYYKGDAWLGRMSAAMKQYGRSSQVDDYIVQERYTGAYATQVAFALWGKKAVEYVQFQVSRQNVIPFGERDDKHAEKQPIQVRTTGWRGVLEMPGQSDADFQGVFGPLAMKQGGE